jgi:hypothetical protein
MPKTTCRAILFAVAALLFLAALPAASARPPHGFTGYCACGCSFVKDCNTSADCGGSACLKGPTCCLAQQ